MIIPRTNKIQDPLSTDKIYYMELLAISQKGVTSPIGENYEKTPLYTMYEYIRVSNTARGIGYVESSCIYRVL